MKMGSFPEARNAFREAVRLRPDDAEAHYNLGLALGKLKRDQEALSEFAQAVKLQPDLARAHRNLGLASLNLNRLDEAKKALQEAAALDPKDPQVRNNLGDLLAKRYALKSYTLPTLVGYSSGASLVYGATGEVANRGAKTFHFVMVRVEFCDSFGRVVGKFAARRLVEIRYRSLTIVDHPALRRTRSNMMAILAIVSALSVPLMTRRA